MNTSTNERSTNESGSPTSDRLNAPQLALLTAPLLALVVTIAMTLSLSTAFAQSAVKSITFAQEVVIDGDGASAVDGHVTIDAAGTYVVSGSTADGSVTVDAPSSAVTLVLDGAAIVNPNGPAILIRAADQMTVTLADGSTNSITDGGESEFDAALYSDVALTIDGGGSLDVHAVYEGISSTSHINFVDGVVRIFAGEDGVNANEDGVSQINVSGGYLFVISDVGDGIDSNGTITITGGVVISQSALVDGNSGLDADGAITIDGGLVIATGGSMMGSVATSSAQKTIVIDYGTTQASGTLIMVSDDSGEEVLTFAPSLSYQQLLLSSPALVDGVTYTVYTGGTGVGDPVDGLFEAGASSTGTVVTTVDTDSAQTAGGRGGGFGRMPGGNQHRP